MLKLSSKMWIIRNDGIESLYESLAKIVEPASTDDIYRAIVEQATNLVDAQYVSIFIEKDDVLKRVFSTTPKSSRVNPTKGDFIYKAYKEKKIYVLNINEVKKAYPDMFLGKTRSLIIVPLSYRKTTLGILKVRSKNFYFDAKKINILKIFAAVASLKIRNAYLHDETLRQLRFRKEFSALASHELKTPLTIISLYSHEIERKLSKGKKINPESFVTIQTQVDKMARIIDEFLTIKKIKKNDLSYKWEVCNILDLLRQVVRNYGVTNPERKIEFSQNLNNSDEIWGDKHKLQEVFVNIINNAIKFSPDSSILNISISKRNKKVVIEFVDRGRGIRKIDLPYIFDPFYKGGKLKKTGIGMGLYLSKNIIKAHKGDITIDSKLNSGTTVEIKLPIMGNASA